MRDQDWHAKGRSSGGDEGGYVYARSARVGIAVTKSGLGVVVAPASRRLLNRRGGRGRGGGIGIGIVGVACVGVACVDALREVGHCLDDGLVRGVLL